MGASVGVYLIYSGIEFVRIMYQTDGLLRPPALQVKSVSLYQLRT